MENKVTRDICNSVMKKLMTVSSNVEKTAGTKQLIDIINSYRKVHGKWPQLKWLNRIIHDQNINRNTFKTKELPSFSRRMTQIFNDQIEPNKMVPVPAKGWDLGEKFGKSPQFGAGLSESSAKVLNKLRDNYLKVNGGSGTVESPEATRLFNKMNYVVGNNNPKSNVENSYLHRIVDPASGNYLRETISNDEEIKALLNRGMLPLPSEYKVTPERLMYFNSPNLMDTDRYIRMTRALRRLERMKSYKKSLSAMSGLGPSSSLHETLDTLNNLHNNTPKILAQTMSSAINRNGGRDNVVFKGISNASSINDIVNNSGQNSGYFSYPHTYHDIPEDVLRRWFNISGGNYDAYVKNYKRNLKRGIKGGKGVLSKGTHVTKIPQAAEYYADNIIPRDLLFENDGITIPIGKRLNAQTIAIGNHADILREIENTPGGLKNFADFGPHLATKNKQLRSILNNKKVIEDRGGQSLAEWLKSNNPGNFKEDYWGFSPAYEAIYPRSALKDKHILERKILLSKDTINPAARVLTSPESIEHIADRNVFMDEYIDKLTKDPTSRVLVDDTPEVRNILKQIAYMDTFVTNLLNQTRRSYSRSSAMPVPKRTTFDPIRQLPRNSEQRKRWNLEIGRAHV